MKKILKSTWTAATVMALSAGSIFAKPLDAPAGFEKLQGDLLSPDSIVSRAIKLLLTVAAVLFFFMLVIGGIKWILSGGDKGKTEEARNQITAALVGLVIVFSAWAISKLIATFFGVDILNLQLNNL